MLAIHARSGSFSDGWVSYCQLARVPFRVVDCYSTNIIDQLQGCRALLWHWEHSDYRAAIFARQLIASVEAMGLVVFPGTATCWHYDDKVGQKYLLEAIGAPLIPSHVFYNEVAASRWLENTELPIVWKLRGGAGSQNVQLVRDRNAARRIIRRSFGRGWRYSRFSALEDRMWHFQRDRSLRAFVDIARGVFRTVVPHEKSRNRQIERHYVYFQEFLSGNNSDIRVVVIGKRAFAIRRLVRKGDFRASGSGVIEYDMGLIPTDCVRIAFEVTRNLGSQSCAFDFVCRNGEWLIGEISYAFSENAYLDCPGYWDPDLNWRSDRVQPARFMIEDILSELRSRSTKNG